MKDTLSYKQLYDELEALNASSYDALLREDFEEFQAVIDDFTSSGIMEQEKFAAAREAYRYSSIPFTLDGLWMGVDSRNPLDNPISAAYITMQELKQRDVYPVYAYMVNNMAKQEKADHKEERLAFKQYETLQKYKELYKNLYKGLFKEDGFSVPLVDDPQKYKMTYIDRITELASVRSNFYTMYNFTCVDLNGRRIIDNEEFKNLEKLEKVKYLTQTFDSLYDYTRNKKTVNFRDFFSFDGYKKVLASNYLQGKEIDRKNWKHYTKGILPNSPKFYLELAFYLTIPSSDEIEKFMNLHGYSFKRSMIHFKNILTPNGAYHVLYKDLCRWIDAGIDYNLLNELFGFSLQIREIRKPKTK